MSTFITTHYEALLDTLAFLPLVLIALLYQSAKNLTWHYRYLIVMILGWELLFADTLLINDLAITYAPSPRLREHAASEDGASTAFVYLFGWVIPLVVTLLFDSIRGAWNFIVNRL